MMMAASTSRNVPSSSPSSTLHYSVFLSFRGKDTRNNFAGHLHMAFKQAGILTFKDDPELRTGEDISDQLTRAIRQSKVSIVVFSKEYASSKWCLNELLEILECKRNLGQMVVPVFYDVDPAVVRHQIDGTTFAEAFRKHEERFPTTKVEKWRCALTEAANLSGYDLKNDANGDEAKLIRKITEETAKKLKQTSLYVARYPIGIESRVESFNNLLSLESNDVRIVAIWGVGGLGKTTTAKAVYNHFSSHFEDRCFLLDIAQTSKQYNGVVTLQNQLISNVLKSEGLKVDNYHQGIEVIQRHFRQRKVLIVLDDVDNVEQLENLGIDRDLFYDGSRIIITTRDISCLSLLEVDDIHMPKELDEQESLELFSYYAFGEDHPKDGYEELSKELVRCAAGLPLVLAIWGPYMRSFKRIELWENALKKLRKIPHNDVHRKLKVSYDSLDDIEQQMFLDIACFFIGMSKNFTVKVLEDEDFGCFSDLGIESLVNRSLLSLNKYEQVSMHDMIRDMGREIVRQESPKIPGKRSRLWDRVDALHVLKKNLGTEAIEGIELFLDESDEELDGEAFEKMSELRFLILKSFHIQGTLASSSEKLKWLYWHGFPFESITSDLYMENLVAIDMPNSKLKQLWIETKSLDRLKFLNLSNSEMLTTSPNFSGLQNLEELLLCDCTSLVELHSSAGCLDKLVRFDLSNCRSLTKIPLSIFQLESLESLDLSHCSRLGYEEPFCLLPSSIQALRRVKRLMLRECNVLVVPNEIGGLQFLEVLDLSENKFSTLPASVCDLDGLKYLFMESCVNLQSIPDLPRNLEEVQANNCPSLEMVSVASHWNKGPFMDFSDCTKLVEKKFTNNFRRQLLQSYQGQVAIPEMNISLSETEIPNWCNYQSMGGFLLSLVVPSFIERKVQGWIMCLVTYGIKDEDNGGVICLMKNMTRDTSCHVQMRIRDWMWLSYVALSDRGFVVDAGDELEISFSTNKRVLGCGLSLVYEGDQKDPERNDELVIEYSAPVNFVQYGRHTAYASIRRTYSDIENEEAMFGVMDLINQASDNYWRNELELPEDADMSQFWEMYQINELEKYQINEQEKYWKDLLGLQDTDMAKIREIYDRHTEEN